MNPTNSDDNVDQLTIITSNACHDPMCERPDSSFVFSDENYTLNGEFFWCDLSDGRKAPLACKTKPTHRKCGWCYGEKQYDHIELITMVTDPSQPTTFHGEVAKLREQMLRLCEHQEYGGAKVFLSLRLDVLYDVEEMAEGLCVDDLIDYLSLFDELIQ